MEQICPQCGATTQVRFEEEIPSVTHAKARFAVVSCTNHNCSWQRRYGVPVQDRGPTTRN